MKCPERCILALDESACIDAHYSEVVHAYFENNKGNREMMRDVFLSCPRLNATIVAACFLESAIRDLIVAIKEKE